MAGCELTMPLGGLAAGLLVDGFGAGSALLLFGGTYLLTTLAPLVFPAWRGLDRKPGVSRTGRPLPGSAREERSPHPSAR